MKSRQLKLSLALNIILVIFLILYFLFPYLKIDFLKTVFTPSCQVIKTFQGVEYLPGWCVEVFNQSDDSEKLQDDDIKEEDTGLANPAAVKCEKDGGTIESFETTQGTDALCKFNDGSICNEWDYFNNKCDKGECFPECRLEKTRSEGLYNSCTGQLIEYTKCIKDEINKAEDNINITNISANQQLNSPVEIRGTAQNINENKVYIQFVNTKDQVLVSESVQVQADGQFKIEINYDFNLSKEGVIKVYSLTDNGSQENQIAIPVKF